MITSKGLFFEEMALGQALRTRGRTITEADVVAFAGLSGDFNPMHTDAVYASETEFGQRVAHGALCLSIATGLSYQLGFIEGTVLAFRSLSWKFSRPVFIGDTILISVDSARTVPSTLHVHTCPSGITGVRIGSAVTTTDRLIKVDTVLWT